jgi:hypothetical protein
MVGMEDRTTTSSLPKQENIHAATKADRYLSSSLNPPNSRSRYFPEYIKFGNHRSIRITVVQMSNLTQSAKQTLCWERGTLPWNVLVRRSSKSWGCKKLVRWVRVFYSRCGRKGLACTETCRGLYGYCTVGDRWWTEANTRVRYLHMVIRNMGHTGWPKYWNTILVH